MKKIDGIRIANNIRAERNRAGITIEQICEKLKISRPTYINYEKDASNVKTAILLQLADMFECSINMFFYTN